MRPLHDSIHNCLDCNTYKLYKQPCSLSPLVTVKVCNLCTTRPCCLSPIVPLMPCEQDTILDQFDPATEELPLKGGIPFNIITKYCKHLDPSTLNCKVYPIRPIACRIACKSCTSPFWKKMLLKRQSRLNSEQDPNHNLKTQIPEVKT